MVRAMLSESLRAVISQTLLKTKDGGGRVAAHEIMIGTPAIRNLIREARSRRCTRRSRPASRTACRRSTRCLQELVQAQPDRQRDEARNGAPSRTRSAGG